MQNTAYRYHGYSYDYDAQHQLAPWLKKCMLMRRHKHSRCSHTFVCCFAVKTYILHQLSNACPEGTVDAHVIVCAHLRSIGIAKDAPCSADQHIPDPPLISGAQKGAH